MTKFTDPGAYCCLRCRTVTRFVPAAHNSPHSCDKVIQARRHREITKRRDWVANRELAGERKSNR